MHRQASDISFLPSPYRNYQIAKPRLSPVPRRNRRYNPLCYTQLSCSTLIGHRRSSHRESHPATRARGHFPARHSLKFFSEHIVSLFVSEWNLTGLRPEHPAITATTRPASHDNRSSTGPRGFSLDPKPIPAFLVLLPDTPYRHDIDVG